MKPLVSIIVITYNSIEYILETLNSVFTQTYQNLELIVTDDCSGDNTVELAELWINEHKDRFLSSKIITTPVNTGTPANCNRGIKICKGQWIKIIAGDDILMETCVASFVEELANNPESRFIASDMQYMNAAGEIQENMDFMYNAIRGYFFSLKAEEQLKLYARIPLFLNSPSFFMHKPTLERINYFDEEFRIYDDLPLILKLLEKGIRIDYLDKKTE